MNNASFVGNLGADPVLRTTASGVVVCNFSIAIDGPHNTVTWIKCVCWADEALRCQKYLQKGSQVAVNGSFRNRTWEDRAGEKRESLELVVNNITYLAKINSPAQGEESF